MTLNEAAAFLNARNDFLILTHKRPDGDTVGSGAALCRLHRLKRVELEEQVDPALLGGFRLELQGVTYDKSVRGGLTALARTLGEERVQ